LAHLGASISVVSSYPVPYALLSGRPLLSVQQIRYLCARVTLANSEEQFKAALMDLKLALLDEVTDSVKKPRDNRKAANGQKA
jgi:hypothetical protein